MTLAREAIGGIDIRPSGRLTFVGDEYPLALVDADTRTRCNALIKASLPWLAR